LPVSRRFFPCNPRFPTWLPLPWARDASSQGRTTGCSVEISSDSRNRLPARSYHDSGCRAR
jgi:hypothetical protein